MTARVHRPTPVVWPFESRTCSCGERLVRGWCPAYPARQVAVSRRWPRAAVRRALVAVAWVGVGLVAIVVLTFAAAFLGWAHWGG